ncbi:MAG: DnaB-like helicase N-terminal domain-containing protein [[Ruminococcus] torques]|nr:MAG TPA: Helicase REPLICATION [Caudoviricetes sp.]
MKKSKLLSYVNKQAIREVLGSLLQEPSLIREYKIVQNDFPETFHKLIFAAINNLYKNGAEEIDAVAIDEYLSHYETQYQVFIKNEGVSFLEKIQEMALQSNFKYYYDQLKKFSLLRSYVEYGISVEEFFDPDEINPEVIEKQRKQLDEYTIQDIINHYKKKHSRVIAPFLNTEGQDSKKAGVGGHEQKEKWKQDTAWGIGYASAYLTTALHGIRKRRFNIKSAGTGVGKTRTSIADIGYACSPYYYDKSLDKWCENPNGKSNGGLYIGTEMELLEEIDPILWAYIADVPQDHIEFNLYEDGEEERVDKAIDILEHEANIWFEYVPEYDANTLEEIIETHKLEHDIEYVWFDYISATVELNSEYAAESKTKMVVREDQVLANLSKKLKNFTRKFDVSIDSFTQVTGDFKNETNRDQTIVRGAKAIIDKADGAMIAMPPTEKELKKIEPITRELINKPTPNLVYSLYKNRGGKWNKIKIWLYIDYSTMRVHDLFVTDYEYKLIKDMEKTYIDVNDEEYASTKVNIKPVDNLKIKEKEETIAF